MNLRTFKSNLLHFPDRQVRFVLPDGALIPAEFHITEVGHVSKRFIDCGGTQRSRETCLLQAWVSDADPHHRLSGRKLASILDQSRQILPTDNLEVELEYEPDEVVQYSVTAVEPLGYELRVALANKKTDCLAKETCGVSPKASVGCGCGGTSGQCC